MELPWKKEYRVFGIPDTFEPYPEEPVWEILEKTARKYPKNGLIQMGYKLAYPGVMGQANRLAAALSALGLEKGDRMATLLPTSIQFCISDYAIGKAGLVHIPASSLEPQSVLEHKMREGGARALICLDTAEVADKVARNTDIKYLIQTRLIVMHAMTIFGANQVLIPDARDTDSMASMIEQYNPVLQFVVPTQFMKMSQTEIKRREILGLSGSAPLPENTQKEFEKTAGGGIMEGYGLSEMSPVTHLNTSFLLHLMGGRTALRINNFFLGIPGLIPVVNFFMRLAGPGAVGRITGKGIWLLVKISRRRAMKGKTEKRGTAGIPYPDTVIRLSDVNTGHVLSSEEMAAGEPGELCMKGPQRMLGYWPEPGSGMDEDGFVHTSDVVKIDERGYFYIVDRTKDMIIVSGYKVYSREIDDLLYDHPKIEMAAAVAIPDPDREGSERVALYIQPAPCFRDSLSEQEIIDFPVGLMGNFLFSQVHL